MTTPTTVRLNNGAHMPLVGLGTWQASVEDAERAVSFALTHGYKHIDTARIYNNESGVGLGIQKADMPRDEIFVTTKLWNEDHNNPVAALEGSLRRLNVDFIDQYLIHWPVSQRNDSWRKLEKLYTDGVCKSIGVSNFTIQHLQQLFEHSDIVPAVNQVEFSPFLFQKELLDFCKQHKIQLVAYSPLSRASNFSHPILKQIATTHKKSTAQVMLRWALQHNVVVIPKSINPNRITENNDIFDFTLSSEDMKKLNSLHDDTRHCPDPAEMP